MTVAKQLVEIDEKLVKGPCNNSFNSYFEFDDIVHWHH